MNLIVDLNNAVSVQRHGKLGRPKTRSSKERLAKETLFVNTLRSILHTARVTNSTQLVIVQDSRGLWRRELYPTYKVSEEVDKKEDFYQEDVIGASELLFEFFRDNTAAFAIDYPRAEGDDIIGVWCLYSETKNTIMSSDKDYIQLVSERNMLYYPTGREYRTTDDASYDLFLKCIRGDRSDKIRSVWSGIRETRLIKAWEDPIEMVNLMESTTPTGEKFKDLYNLNRSVIDLKEIPIDLRDGILDEIDRYVPSVYREMKSIKWVYDMTGIDITKDIIAGAPIFRRSPSFLK